MGPLQFSERLPGSSRVPADEVLEWASADRKLGAEVFG
jgi:hypothetical protein